MRSLYKDSGEGSTSESCHTVDIVDTQTWGGAQKKESTP